MLPSMKISCLLPAGPVITALKVSTLSLCENGANEGPRFQEMVGTGLAEEKQAILTESPSCTMTVSFRFMVDGVPAKKTWFHKLVYHVYYMFYLCSVASVLQIRYIMLLLKKFQPIK